MYFLLKMGGIHCHVSLPECSLEIVLPPFCRHFCCGHFFLNSTSEHNRSVSWSTFVSSIVFCSTGCFATGRLPQNQMLNVDAVLVVGHGQECDNFQQKVSGYNPHCFNRWMHLVFLSSTCIFSYPTCTIHNLRRHHRPEVVEVFFRRERVGHGSLGFGKHLPNDRRFGCRSSAGGKPPLRISRKLVSYRCSKAAPSWHDRSIKKE